MKFKNVSITSSEQKVKIYEYDFWNWKNRLWVNNDQTTFVYKHPLSKRRAFRKWAVNYNNQSQSQWFSIDNGVFIPVQIALSFSLFCLLVGAFLNKIPSGFVSLGVLVGIVVLVFSWFLVLNKEHIYTDSLQYRQGVYIGVQLFILTEFMLFFTFFWGFFHSSLSPNVFLSVQWPPFNLGGYHLAIDYAKEWYIGNTTTALANFLNR